MCFQRMPAHLEGPRGTLQYRQVPSNVSSWHIGGSLYSGGPHWKVPVHIGGSLYSGQSNVMTFSLSPVLNWRYNSKQGDRDFVSTIKLGYRENVFSSVWLTFRSPSLVTFRFPSLVNQSNVSKNNVNQSVSLLKKVHELILLLYQWRLGRGQFLAPQKPINFHLNIF